jgi:ABC-2 type transport system ATP-binding protein
MAAIISADGVSKTFHQLRRQPGIGGALKSLFSRTYTDIRAVDGLSFAIQPGEAVGYLAPMAPASRP